MILNELKIQIEIFKRFIEHGIKKNKEKVSDIKKDLAVQHALLSGLTRSERRSFQKAHGKEIYNKNDMEKTNELIKYLEGISDFLDDENYENTNYKLNSNFDLKMLIYLISSFSERIDEVIVLNPDLPRHILGLFVKNLKSQNISSRLLDCFDKNGKIILEKVVLLNIYLGEDYKEMLSSSLGLMVPISKEKVLSSIISKELLNKSQALLNEKNKKEQEEKRRKLEEEKQRKLEEQKKLELLQSKGTDVKDLSIKRVKKTDPEYILFTKYINPYNYELKPASIEDVNYDDFSNDLSKLDLPKSQLNKYLDDFLKIRFDRNISILSRILDKKNELKKLKEIIENPLDHEETFKKVKSFILSDDFKKTNDKEKKDKIKELLDEATLINSQEIQNLIVFSEENLLDKEIDIIYSKGDKKEAIKGIYHHLLTLKSVNLDELKANKEDSFHELYNLRNIHECYIIDNKLKCYRYGPKKIKIYLGILSATEENKKRLQEKYNTSVNCNLLLVFGAGSVKLEDEKDLDIRAKKYGMNNSENISRIYDIFAKPFTDESFEIACKLIETGFIKIDSIKPQENNKEFIIKKVEN